MFYFLLLAAFAVSLFSCSPAYACPQFVEFFPDPVAVSDQEGEFVEIRLDDFFADSLYVQFEQKAPLAFPFPRGGRLVLVHDSLACPVRDNVQCGLLGSVSLPNSRETGWQLRAGECADSVVLPVPKPGKSLQRVKGSDEWTLAEPTPGMANPSYEVGVADCALELREAEFLPGKDSSWSVVFGLSGCDSSRLEFALENLFTGQRQKKETAMGESFSVEFQGAALGVQAKILGDEVPFNDALDTLLVSPGASPAVVSEVHHCPEEPMPEWVEVLNRSSRSLPLSRLRFCDRGGFWASSATDSLLPHESLVLTRDTLQLRSVLGFGDVRLLQVAMGYLNNTGGSVSLCYGEVLLDSVSWTKSTVSCPLGFNPQTGRAENTPGFQGSSRKKSGTSPVVYKLSSRTVRPEKTPLRVYVESELDVTLKLLDSAGQVRWSRVAPSSSDTWWDVPLTGLQLGVAYISLAAGAYKEVVGILLRP